jgi:hypothetical protein
MSSSSESDLKYNNPVKIIAITAVAIELEKMIVVYL